MTIETRALTLIRTKLQRPRLPGDLIPRARLLDQLHAQSDRKLTLISAMAGTGKTTLLAQWLEECPQPGAWLSLDEHDNDRIVFLSYLCAAIRSVFPDACESVFDLLNALQPPPADVIIAAIVNELDELVATLSQSFAAPPKTGGPSTAPWQEGGRSQNGLILALDDYHRITEPAIHEILSSLIEHLPQGMHLALATRTDPQLPLAGLRARREMTEVRSASLRFTSEEACSFLEATTGRELDPETIRLLEDKTEGWVVGLRLAALSMRTLADDEAFVQGFRGTGSDLIVEYLVSEVLARQPAEIQDFALRSAVLERFCAPLCDALTGVSATKSQEIIERIARANLFLTPLDVEGKWYRFHHLFRDLLRHKLRQQTNEADISGLHARAGAWFAQNGLIDEALHHFLAADDTAAAVALVAGQRYGLMNRAQWPRLERYLHAFSPDVVDQSPELLMLKAWLLYHRGQFAELPAEIQRIEAALVRTPLAPEAVERLQGEVSALRSIISCFAVDAESTLAHGRQALAKTPRELWIVRIAARLYMAGALLMMGDVNGAYEAVYAGFEEEGDQSNAFKATLLATACNIHWMTADLLGLARAAELVLALSQEPYSPQFWAWGHYHLGRVRYHHGDLTAAEEHFAAVVQQPYLSYGICYVNSACGLALTHQALGRPNHAREVVETAVAFTLETGNTTLLPVALAFQAELALMQGQIAAAGQQAARFDPVPPLSPMYGLFSPYLTLVKVWLAQNAPASRGRAAELVGRVRAFCETTHTTRFLIEALALQALLHEFEGDEPAALAALEQAVTLAEPGGFLRLFVDLGPPLDRLLDRLRWQGVAPEYVTQILIAFGMKDDADADIADVDIADVDIADADIRRRTTEAAIRPSPSVASGLARGPSSLIEPLTPRELDVLALLGRHLSNKEIAEELVVSPSTVKTHTLHIYRKLDVNSRKQAVVKARELNILAPNVM
jgi:LuxR family maltose regulon positive regulatory protein